MADWEIMQHLELERKRIEQEELERLRKKEVDAAALAAEASSALADVVGFRPIRGFLSTNY